MKILFVLPTRGGGGGSHSIAQEVDEMIHLGIDVIIAVNEKNALKFATTYADMPSVCRVVRSYKDTSELAQIIKGKDLVVCTIFTTIDVVMDSMQLLEGNTPRLAYYIQDYEPLFSAVDDPLHHQAYTSYEKLPNALLYAKTNWIREVVTRNHGVHVEKVSPSLDTKIYYPITRPENKTIKVSVMVRPSTPRRAPRRTMTLLKELNSCWGERVSLNVFGCTDEDIIAHQLPNDFPYVNHGVLSRMQVGSLLRHSDVFLDLSDYQAFGRTGLEAMACGCACILPAFGGANEYSIDKINSRMVDTRSIDCILDAFKWYEGLCADSRLALRQAAIEKSLEYSVRRAAISELTLFEEHLAA